MYCEWRELHNYHAKKAAPVSSLILKELKDMTDSEMCEVLGKFLLEIRKQIGEEYPHETVYEMCI